MRPVRATPEGKDATPPPAGTIFYAGKSYTEAEYKAAIESGSLGSALPPVAPAGSATAAAYPTFTEVMGFSGAPEIINGRLAMLGFVAAVGAELASGESVLKQLADEPTGVTITFLLFIAASLIPAFLRKSDSLGPFTPAAELLNGRAAMLGFAALLAVEAIRQSPLF